MLDAAIKPGSPHSLTRTAFGQWRGQIMKQQASGAVFTAALTLTLTGYFTGASWLFWLTLPIAIIAAMAAQSALLRSNVAAMPSPVWFAWRDIHLSPTELRLLAASLAYGSLSFLFLAIFLGANAILLLKIGHAIGGEYGGDMDAIKRNGNLLMLINLGIILLALWLLVRLSLFQAATLNENRVRLFGAWHLTSRRYWRLFGTIIVLKIIAIMALVLMLSLIGAMDGKYALLYRSAGPMAALIGTGLFAAIMAYVVQPLWSGVMIACLKHQG